MFLHTGAAEHQRFMEENRERIQAVEKSFTPRGTPLLAPGRVLIGEGRLLKLSRRKPQPKAVYLFNDILVYGSVVVAGRWNRHQQILSLEEMEQENLEDGVGMRNRWVLRTPRKSFQLSAVSVEEKRAWMENIERCRAERLKQIGFPAAAKPLAAIWIPDAASAVCMRCTEPFNATQRRHHCRHCGFVVCNSCSKGRAVLQHISSKPVRVCRRCNAAMRQQEVIQRATREKHSMEEMPEYEKSSDEEQQENHTRATDTHKHTHTADVYEEPEPPYREPQTHQTSTEHLSNT